MALTNLDDTFGKLKLYIDKMIGASFKAIGLDQESIDNINAVGPIKNEIKNVSDNFSIIQPHLDEIDTTANNINAVSIVGNPANMNAITLNANNMPAILDALNNAMIATTKAQEAANSAAAAATSAANAATSETNAATSLTNCQIIEASLQPTNILKEASDDAIVYSLTLG